MRNAKEEFLSKIDTNKMLCAVVNDPSGVNHTLKVNYSQENLQSFLESIDFEYDAGYGCEQLSGSIVLMEDNIWFDRGEYDGSEWWQYHKYPDTPEECR